VTDLGEALLRAHVEYELARLRGDAVRELIAERVAACFRWLDEMNFRDLVTPAQIIGVIDRYVIELKISGGIAELAGEMANVVFLSKLSAETRVEQICPSKSYEGFAEKVAALESARRGLANCLLRSSPLRALVARTLSRLILSFLVPGAGAPGASRLQELVASLRSTLLSGLEDRAAAAIERAMKAWTEGPPRGLEEQVLASLDLESLRDVADEIWDEVSQKRLAEAVSGFTAQDLEDFVVLGYEFWLSFRSTEYFRGVAGEVVERLFEKYGDESVLAVIDDMGVTEQMVTHELQTFLIPLLEQAHRAGFLEEQLRFHLEPFYRSPAVQALLMR
jgi:hypothetical protein